MFLSEGDNSPLSAPVPLSSGWQNIDSREARLAPLGKELVTEDVVERAPREDDVFP